MYIHTLWGANSIGYIHSYSRVHGMRDPKMLGGESLVEIQIIMLVKQTVFKILKVDCRKTFDSYFF